VDADGGRQRFHRGRTWILAFGDASALLTAYAAAYIVAAMIAPLPPVSAAPWFLALVAVTAPFVWAGVFAAYHLYENDNLKISVSSFDEVRDLFHALLAGSLGYLIVSQGIRVAFGWWIYAPAEALLFLSGASLRYRSFAARSVAGSSRGSCGHGERSSSAAAPMRASCSAS